MKICWDNLEKLTFTKNGNFKVNGVGSTYYEKICTNCKNFFLGQSSNIYCDDVCAKTSEIYLHKKSITLLGKPGTPLGKESREKISIANSKDKHPLWKGGYDNIPLYDTYACQLEPYEQCRRNADDPNILEVKCTYCGKWYMPTLNSVRHRIQRLNSDANRFYCHNNCKKVCPLFNQSAQQLIKQDMVRAGLILPEELIREVQPELRQMSFARDDYICVKCGSTGPLHCHHIDPVISNPIESADVDNCITLCVNCHKEAHKISGCGYHELRDCT
jgi:5-methylcytosine-specific restriction endonuclease McrA